MTKQIDKYKFQTATIFASILIFLCGCATIPSEAPELSAELGNRISALEESNLNLLHKFFGLKRTEIDNFIQDEWIPEFIENVFKDPQMKENWDIIVKENNPSERYKFLKITGLKIQEEINSKRVELIQPLDDLERLLEQNIRYEYNYARSINNSITSFLLSASKVDENSKRYLKLIGITDVKINNVIDSTNEIVQNLVAKRKDIEDKIEKGKEYINDIKSLKNSLTKKKENQNAN